MHLKMSKVCLVTGVGPETGTGAEIAKYFSENGFHVAMIARSEDNLKRLESKYPNTKAYPCDVADIALLKKKIKKIENDMGRPEVVIHNAPMANRGPMLELDYNDLERNFRVNTTALLVLAQETIPNMLEMGRGSIMVTGNTAAERGKAHWGFFAATKSAQRILSESLAREFGPQGIHVAYFIIDALIDTPRTRPRLAPDKPDEFFAAPKQIAKEIYHVVHQEKSAWSFRVELRPFAEHW
jgi:short-subunit dehydrogenase